MLRLFLGWGKRNQIDRNIQTVVVLQLVAEILLVPIGVLWCSVGRIWLHPETRYQYSQALCGLGS